MCRVIEDTPFFPFLFCLFFITILHDTAWAGWNIIFKGDMALLTDRSFCLYLYYRPLI